MVKVKVFFCVLFILYFSSASGQEHFRVMFYNTENLYDTIRNQKIKDEEFTPEGDLNWGTYRYYRKLENISQVISSVGGEFPPALVGLCEVENKNVINDLVKNSSLKKHKYKYVITNSKDYRGSNIAFLYQRDQFKLVKKKTYRPKFPDKGTTRDILHVTGLVVSGDSLDIFICHFPSRGGGQKKTESKRIVVANLLKNQIEETIKKRRNPRILVMGDFNDTPLDKSLKGELQTKPVQSLRIEKGNQNQLYNLFEGSKDVIKSYFYAGNWDYYDQFLANGSFLDSSSSCYILDKRGSTYAPEFILRYDDKYRQNKPFRTYLGWKYLGGYSDHLPIYMDLFILE